MQYITPLTDYIKDLLPISTVVGIFPAKLAAAPFWSTISMKDEKEKKRLTYLRTMFSSLLITGPFSIVFGFKGGLMALNDRLKL